MAQVQSFLWITEKNQESYTTFPETNIAPENGWLEDDFDFWEGLLSGPMLVLERVPNNKPIGILWGSKFHSSRRQLKIWYFYAMHLDPDKNYPREGWVDNAMWITSIMEGWIIQLPNS